MSECQLFDTIKQKFVTSLMHPSSKGGGVMSTPHVRTVVRHHTVGLKTGHAT